MCLQLNISKYLYLTTEWKINKTVSSFNKQLIINIFFLGFQLESKLFST